MKINKNEFKYTGEWKHLPELILEKVLYPFVPMINMMKLKVFFSRQNNFDGEILLDWSMYELILFNIVQNAIKYNQIEGNIIIILSCLPQNNGLTDDMYVLETKVIDTGLGISDEIKNTLFIPFRELRTKVDFNTVTNKTIGLGLSFSQRINSQLNGNIKLLVNENNLTVFAFRLPVKYRRSRIVEYVSYDKMIGKTSDKFRFLQPYRILTNSDKFLEETQQAYIDNLNLFAIVPLKFESLILRQSAR